MKRNLMIVSALVMSLLLFGCVSSSLNKGSVAKDALAVNFVVMGDNRPADPFKPEQPYIHHKIVDMAVALKPEIILNTGDIVVGYDAISKEEALREFDDFEKVTKPIRDNKIPLCITMGNHAGYTEFARSEFTKRYKNHATGKLYYSADIENCHFVILTSEREGEQSQITGEQWEWLKRDLKQAGDKHKFVLVHRPLYPKIEHLKDSLNKYPEKRDELAMLLKKHRVDMVFAGHVHIYNFSVVDGLSQIIAGGSGAPLVGTLAEGRFNHFFQVIVKGADVEYRLLPVENETLLATELLEKGETGGALGLAKIAMQTVPEHPVPYIIATVGHQLMGQQNESKEMAGKLQEILGNRPDTFFRLGEYALSVKKLELADTYLSQALKLDEDNFAINYHYAKLKQQQKQYPVAIDMYEKALPLTKNTFYIDDIEKQIKAIKGN